MKLHATTGEVMLCPETVEECGVMHWLTMHFAGRCVYVHFDTTTVGDNNFYPMMWLEQEVRCDDK